MANVKIVQNQNERHYKVNDDIEEIISGGSNEQKLDITKVVNDNTAAAREQALHNKIELSSNKDVTIGLDLLMNKDKVNKEEEPSELKPVNIGSNIMNSTPNNVDSPKRPNMSDTNVINLNQIDGDIDFGKLLDKADPSNALVKELDLDKTSRLSQQEIDAFIDKKDAQDTPQLVEPSDLNNDDNRTRENNDDRYDRDSHESDYSKHNNRSNHRYNRYDDGQHNRNRDYHHRSNYNDYNNYPLQRSPEDIAKERKEKEEIIWQLEKYRRLGIQGIRKFNMSCDLEEMQAEYNKIKKQRELENSIKFQRKCLCTFAAGTELLNSKLDFLDFKLDGWSEQVNENVEEYNEVFEELHEKYSEKAKMAPELKLVFMLGGSAFMYHLTNSMFKNTVPGMEDIMRQNPELMKQFADAAINQMDGQKQSAAKFFNHHAPPPRMPQGMPRGGDRPMPNQPSFNNQNYRGGPPMSQQRPPAPNRQMPPNRPMPQSSNPPPTYAQSPEPVPSQANQRSTSPRNEVEELTSIKSSRSAFNNGTRKIPAPVGVDDILNELQSNTPKISPNDDESEVLSRSSNLNTRNINIKSRPNRSFNLNLG